MKKLSSELLNELKNATNENRKAVEEFKTLNPELLNQRMNSDSWSMLECIEHLNYYGDFYLKEIHLRIQKAPQADAHAIFKSGLLGNYFALTMLPENGKIKKMKTFKSMDPIGSKLTVATLDRFIEQQQTLLDLLEKSKMISLTKTKTSISISKFIKLRLGDTFRVVVYHNQRHILQARNTLKALRQGNSTN